MKRLVFALLSLSVIMTVQAQTETQRKYLSGHGCDDMVEWDFFCTKGMNSGYWTKIGVPSCWETQGFGQFQYGNEFYGRPFPEGIADEQGLYKYEFTLPESWKNRVIEIVFEGVMTDTEVKINGKPAGEVHHGAFYCFRYDISELVHFGNRKNTLEVTVSKESSNAGVNVAERRADYWNFGGIFRPVYINAYPKHYIRHIAVDATADGVFRGYCYFNEASQGGEVVLKILSPDNQVVARTSVPIDKGDTSVLVCTTANKPKLWSAETPNLYRARLVLLDGNGKELHSITQKFGFRTIEVREKDGLYVNGQKVLLKGVNRHSFRPETGRCLSYAKQVEDVNLIKGMNMNAVRLSHYPADADFYDVCDSLGLYIEDELSGWHGRHETLNGSKLVREMVEHDVNHPSVVLWSNGNETGWNNDLNDDFGLYDPQHRAVLHPMVKFEAFNCAHYNSYGDLMHNLRQPEIYLTTEFLHGLYDGGHGAGLYDYWELMRKAPRCAGGFLWDFADEGVLRLDLDSAIIDTHIDKAPDGIVGPHLEKEGSYFAIKEVWSPVFVNGSWSAEELKDARTLSLQLENRYDFLNLNTVRFEWKWVNTPAYNEENAALSVYKKGELKGPDVAPHASGVLTIPNHSKNADVLLLSAVDKYGRDIFTWSFPMAKDKLSSSGPGQKVIVNQSYTNVTVIAGALTYTFNRNTGFLMSVKRGEEMIPFRNGPRLMAAHRGDRMNDVFTYNQERVKENRTVYTEYLEMGELIGFDIEDIEDDAARVTVKYHWGSLDKVVWTFRKDGSAVVDYSYNFNGIVDMIGICFSFPEEQVLSKRWAGYGPYRVWQNRTQGMSYGIWENDYNDPIPGKSFDYPEFKGYFRGVDWMNIRTSNATITIENANPDDYIGVFQPKDGEDFKLYTLPESGIAILQVIPPVRNKNHETDRIGPSSQPKWVTGEYSGRFILHFDE